MPLLEESDETDSKFPEAKYKHKVLILPDVADSSQPALEQGLLEKLMNFLVVQGKIDEIIKHLFVKLGDLTMILDYMDSSNVEWHVKRGLPKSFRQRKDVVAITGKEKIEDEKIYRQEYHELGLRRDGTPKVHKIFVDAPIGSTIILTEEQYGDNIRKREELKKRYVKKMEKSNPAKKAKKGKLASYCAICKETFRSYIKVVYRML